MRHVTRLPDEKDLEGVGSLLCAMNAAAWQKKHSLEQLVLTPQKLDVAL